MKKILIIDDDKLVANVYRNKFSADGYKVEVAFDGETGLELVRTFNPDLVLLDLMLPKISGIDFLKTNRAEEAFKSLPVVVFSNTYLSNIVQGAWKAGATKCLSKSSATPKQVLDMVGAITQKANSNSTKSEPAVPEEAKVPADGEAEADCQVDLQKSFTSLAPTTLKNGRNQLQLAAKAADEPSKTQAMLELYRLIHTLTANAAIAGSACVAQVADALEALLKELCDKPKNINPSTLRTIASTLDFLGVLVEEAADTGKNRGELLLKPSILVVDDEAISRRAITYALEKAKLPSTSVDNPEAAINLVAENRYELIFLDVDMPRMNGFELCAKLRGTDKNKDTPVIFVTGLNDFDSRANSIMSGGNDLIGKPFLFMELALKALVFILKGRIAQPLVPTGKTFSQAVVTA